MKNLRILIVDDVQADIEHTAAFLRQQGHTVMFAGNGEEGIQMAERELPDLILMDVVMPVVNGFQATRQLSHTPETANIPIIMVSTKGQETDRAWGMRQGARDYVVKPVSAKELLEKISVVLND